MIVQENSDLVQTPRGYLGWWYNAFRAAKPSFVQDCICTSYNIHLVNFTSYVVKLLKPMHYQSIIWILLYPLKFMYCPYKHSTPPISLPVSYFVFVCLPLTLVRSMPNLSCDSKWSITLLCSSTPPISLSVSCFVSGSSSAGLISEKKKLNDWNNQFMIFKLCYWSKLSFFLAFFLFYIFFKSHKITK